MTWLRDSIGTYMIIGPERLLDSVSDLVTQKQERGFDVIVTSLSDIRGTTQHDAIRNHVLQKLPDYLLLVGDHASFPGYPVNISGQDVLSDNYFSTRDNEFMPQVATGRLSSDNPKTLENIVERLTRYPADSSSSWRRRVILTGWTPRAPDSVNSAGEPVVWPEDANNRCMVEIGPYYDVGMYFEYDPKYWCYTEQGRQIWNLRPESSKASLIAAIGQGAAIVRYLGHGNTGVWNNIGLHDDGTNEDFTVHDVGKLKVGDRLPLILSLSCYGGQTAKDSLAEEFLVQGKAVGVLASDGKSDSGYMDQIAPRIFRFNVAEEKRRVGDIVRSAMYDLQQSHDNLKYYHAMMKYLGDPDTILVAPEDTGTYESHRCLINIDGKNGQSKHHRSIEFAKRIRRVYPVLNGWKFDFRGDGTCAPLKLNLDSRLSHMSVNRTVVDVGVDVAFDCSGTNRVQNGYVDAFVVALVDKE